MMLIAGLPHFYPSDENPDYAWAASMASLYILSDYDQSTCLYPSEKYRPAFT